MRSEAHATFHLERTYGASPARVWKALTDPVAEAQWFGVASDQVEIIERGIDVRPGGRERLKGRFGRPIIATFDAIYYEVIQNERLVYCYEMHLDDRKISVSVATVQLKADGKRTLLMVTEQGAFLDGCRFARTWHGRTVGCAGPVADGISVADDDHGKTDLRNDAVPRRLCG
jgi:uncharacterized protein YndB with AHSA1/START domain